MKMKWFFCFLFNLSLFGNLNALTISKNSKVYIFIPEKPSETEIFASSELSRYLNKILSVKAEIKNEEEKISEGIIFSVGKTKSSKSFSGKFDSSITGPGEDSFIIKIKKNKIFLCGGGDRGTLYSVYQFLEELGCRWFMPGKIGEVIPEKKRIVLEEKEKIYIPDFVQREICVGGGKFFKDEEIIDWAAKNKINRIFNLRYKCKEEWKKRGGYLNWQHICHNYFWIIPTKKYFKKHPEYYAFYKGERVPLGMGTGGGNVCTTNPDVIKIFADFINNWFDKNPDGQIFPISPNDGPVKWCECENCKKLGGINFMPGKLGSMTKRQVKFVNEIAKLVYKKHPDRYLLYLAYSNYIDPEPDMPLEKNVVVQVCHYGCYAHGIDKCKENEKAKWRMEQWAKLTDAGIGIWDYFLLQVPNSGSPLTPVPFATTAKDTILFIKKLADKHKIKAYYFTQAGSDLWFYNPLPYYTIAKLTWDTKQDFKELVKDFCYKFYGKAGKWMEKYYNLIEKANQNSSWHPTYWRDISVPSSLVFTPEVIRKAESYLNKAEKSAEDEMVKKRISIVRESFNYARTYVFTDRFLSIKNGKAKLLREENFYILNPEGKAIEKSSSIIEDIKKRGISDKQLERKILRGLPRKMPLITLENENISVSVLPDIGGRIVRLIDKKKNINLLYEPPSEQIIDLDKFYVDYGGYEEYAGKQFASPGWESIYDYKISDDKKSISMSCKVFPFLLEREIILKKNGVEIISSVKNISDKETKVKLRVHPKFRIYGDIEDYYVYIFRKNYKLKKIPLMLAAEKIPLQPAPEGIWAVVNENKNIGVLNYFEPVNTDCYIWVDTEKKDAFTMELMSEEKKLKKGEMIELKHSYVIINDEKELSKLLKTEVEND